MNVKGLFEKFKKMVEKDYPKILIGFEKKKDYYRIFYYLEEFNINDKKFRETIGNAIRNTFYAKGILNLGQTNINLEKAKEVFPELNTKDKVANLRIVLKTKYESTIEETETFKKIIRKNIEEKNIESKLNIFNPKKYSKYVKFNDKKYKELSLAS